LTVFFCVWCGRPSRSLWQALAVAGLTGFATAIGIHPLIGYLSPSHLAPAVTAAALFIAGLMLSAGPMGGLRIAKSVGPERQTDRAAERRSTV
jgi:formate hydrogenlyase subunit 3/multisubunit Na+/H+ antiporter MnhD subunit